MLHFLVILKCDDEYLLHLSDQVKGVTSFQPRHG